MRRTIRIRSIFWIGILGMLLFFPSCNCSEVVVVCFLNGDCKENQICHPQTNRCDTPCRSNSGCRPWETCIESACLSKEETIPEKTPEKVPNQEIEKKEKVPEKEKIGELPPEDAGTTTEKTPHEEKVTEKTPHEEKEVFEKLPVGTCVQCFEKGVFCQDNKIITCTKQSDSCFVWKETKVCGTSEEPFFLNGSNEDMVYSIANDSQGHLYATGYFYEGEMRFANKVYKTNSFHDSFLLKIRSDGSLVWIKTFLSNLSSSEIGRKLVVDSQDNLYLALTFSGTIELNQTYKTQGSEDILVSKWDSNGNILWSKQLGGAGSSQIRDLVVDSQNNLYLTGFFEGSFSSDAFSATSKGGKDFFLLKWNASQKTQWLKTWGGTGDDVINRMVLSTQSKLYLAGYFSSPLVTLDNSLSMASAGSDDGFVLECSTDGKIQRIVTLTGKEKNRAYSVAVNSKNEIYVTGRFGTGCKVSNTTLVSKAQGDVFVIKLDIHFQLLWAQVLGPASIDFPNDIVLDSAENLRVSGFFQTLLAQGSFSLKSKGGNDLFVVKMDSQGIVQWGVSVDLAAYDFGSQLSIDSQDNTYFSSSMYTYSLVKQLKLWSSGKNDAIVNKIDPQGKLFTYCEP